MVKIKICLHERSHISETNLIFLIPTAYPSSWNFMIGKRYRKCIYEIKYKLSKLSLDFFPLVMPVMKVFVHHFFPEDKHGVGFLKLFTVGSK